MPFKTIRLFLLGLALLAPLACSNDDDDDSATILSVIIDESCQDVCTDIAVVLDGRPVALELNAGQEWSDEIEPGSYVITAQSKENCRWNMEDLEADDVPDEGLEKTLSCNLPESPYVRIVLDDSCAEQCSNVVITLDGEEVGTLAEPGDELTVDRPVGDVERAALSEEGCEWDGTLTISPMGLNDILTCEE